MKKIFIPVVALSAFMLFPVSAFAYLDPGTGSAIIQGLLGAVAALAVVLKLYWHRLLKLFGLRKDTLKNESDKKDS